MISPISNLESPNLVLGEAINEGDLDRVQLALANRANPSGSYMGAPFIWLAASKGRLDIVKALVARKVDVNVVHNFESPMAVAVYHDHGSVVLFLAQNGGKMIDRNTINTNSLRREHPGTPVLQQMSSSPLAPHSSSRSLSSGTFIPDKDDLLKYIMMNPNKI